MASTESAANQNGQRIVPGDRRRIAWKLSTEAQILPPAERQKFREFIFSLPGAEPDTARKTHSWRRKKSLTRRRRNKPTKKVDRQMKLDL